MHAWVQMLVGLSQSNFFPISNTHSRIWKEKATCGGVKPLHSLIAQAFEVLVLVSEQEVV